MFPNGSTVLGRLLGRTLLVVLSTAFLSESLGFFTHQLSLALGVLLFGAFILSLPRPRPGKLDFHAWSSLLVVLTAFAFLRLDTVLRPLVVSACLMALHEARARSEESGSYHRSLAIGILSFGVVLVFEKHSPLVWSLIHSCSVRYSELVGRLAGTKISIGPSLSGGHLTILLLSVAAGLSFSSAPKRPVGLVLVVALLIAANGAAVLLIHPIARAVSLIAPGSFGSVRSYDRVLLSLPLLTFALSLMPLYVALKAFPVVEDKAQVGNKLPAFLGAAGILASILLLVWTLPTEGPQEARISFYEKGFLNWMRPVHGQYGSRSGGMFGNLPLFVEALGFESVAVDSIDTNSLRDTDVLFMINTDHRLPDHSYEAIGRFVERGGSLVLLGDHTFFKDDKTNWLNAVLRPFGIRYRFDSADYFIGGWLHSYFYPASPLTAGFSDEQNEVGSVVGASLDISYPAVPIVIGRFGFSDEGRPDFEEGGYIGDLEYRQGERLGDAILVAAQNYGKGKVLVFGDTSGFVNPLMVDTYRFLSRVLRWSAGEARIPAYGIRLFFSLLLLGGSVWLFSKSRFRGICSVLIPVLVAVPVFLAQNGLARRGAAAVRGDYVLVDDSHHGRFPVEFWQPCGLMGLHLNFMRNGYLSFTMHDFSVPLLNGSRVLVFVAPAKSFTCGEISVLDDYVTRGGVLILCVGYEEKAASMALLDHFGFDIENVPLGAFHTDVPGAGVSVSFREAWPVSYSAAEVEVVAGRGEYPTAVFAKRGRGEIVVFGDTGFFYNVNIETEDGAVGPNIDFLAWLLDHIEIAGSH